MVGCLPRRRGDEEADIEHLMGDPDAGDADDYDGAPAPMPASDPVEDRASFAKADAELRSMYERTRSFLPPELAAAAPARPDDDDDDDDGGDETSELDILKIENETLRRRLATLERALGEVEKRQDRARQEAMAAAASARQPEDRAALARLEELERRIRAAKAEAMQFQEFGKEQLAEDVQRLWRLLKKSKSETARALARSEDLEVRLAVERRRSAELQISVEAGEQAFLQVHARDRRVSEKRLKKLSAQLARRDGEVEALFAWVQARQQCLLTVADAVVARKAGAGGGA